MKRIRLVEEYDPMNDSTSWWVEEEVKWMWCREWRYVKSTVTFDKDKAGAIWATARQRGVAKTKTVIDEAVIP